MSAGENTFSYDHTTGMMVDQSRTKWTECPAGFACFEDITLYNETLDDGWNTAENEAVHYSGAHSLKVGNVIDLVNISAAIFELKVDGSVVQPGDYLYVAEVNGSSVVFSGAADGTPFTNVLRTGSDSGGAMKPRSTCTRLQHVCLLIIMRVFA